MSVVLDVLGWLVSLGADAGIMASGGGAAFGVASFFLRGRVGKIAMIGLAGTLLLAGAFVAGILHEKRDNKREQLEARIAVLEFELQTANELAQLGFQQMRNQETRAAERAQLQKDYDAVLASRPAGKVGPCALDDVDVRWLCNIRGGC